MTGMMICVPPIAMLLMLLFTGLGFALAFIERKRRRL